MYSPCVMHWQFNIAKVYLKTCFFFKEIDDTGVGKSEDYIVYDPDEDVLTRLDYTKADWNRSMKQTRIH